MSILKRIFLFPVYGWGTDPLINIPWDGVVHRDVERYIKTSQYPIEEGDYTAVCIGSNCKINLYTVTIKKDVPIISFPMSVTPAA